MTPEDLKIQDILGDTALDYAKTSNNAEAEKLLAEKLSTS